MRELKLDRQPGSRTLQRRALHQPTLRHVTPLRTRQACWGSWHSLSAVKNGSRDGVGQLLRRSRPTKCQRQSREHRKVGVKPDALNATDTEHGQAVVVLQAAEFPFDGGAAAVEAAPLVALARDAKLALLFTAT